MSLNIFKKFKKEKKKKKKLLTKEDYKKSIHKLIYDKDFQNIEGEYLIFDMWKRIIKIKYEGNHVVFFVNNVEKIKIWKDEDFLNKEDWIRFLNYDL